MKVETSVVWIRMPIPPAFPPIVIEPGFDVVERKIVSLEPANIESDGIGRWWKRVGIDTCFEYSRFGVLGVEPGRCDEGIASESALE